MTKKYTTYLIGDKFTNIYGQQYEVIGYCKNCLYRIIRFDSGCIKKVYTASIRENKIQDYNSPTIYGVGCLGMENSSKHYLYSRWINMMGRCYSPKHRAYKSYGAKGITVEDYLMNFKNYIDFIESLPNANKLKTEPDKWQIDKDYKKGNCYSRETISIIKFSENLEIENSAKRIKIGMYTLKYELISMFNSISEAEKITGIHKGNISRVIRGESHTAGGYRWKRAEEEDYVC